MLVLPIVSFWNQNMGNNAFKRKYSNAFKIKYYKFFFAKKALRDFGDIIRYFYVLSTKCLYLLLLLIFFLFQIKTCDFHLKEEGKELLGMLMAALANNNGYYVLYLFPLSFSNNQLLFQKLIGISQRC